MAKANKILIIDDDPELRDALTEQLSLHEEFEAVAVENGSNPHLLGVDARRRPRQSFRYRGMKGRELVGRW